MVTHRVCTDNFLPYDRYTPRSRQPSIHSKRVRSPCLVFLGGRRFFSRESNRRHIRPRENQVKILLNNYFSHRCRSVGVKGDDGGGGGDGRNVVRDDTVRRGREGRRTGVTGVWS